MHLQTKTNFNKSRIFSLLLSSVIFLVLSLQPASAQQTFTGSDGVDVTITDNSRIVSIGSAVTETIFALNAGENVIAVDESSLYPEETAELQKVSFTRNLSAEGILSTSPSAILASGAAGPESAIRQIRSTDVPMLMLPADETIEAAMERIEILGKIFERESEAAQLKKSLEADLSRAESIRETIQEPPKVLFIYARGPNNMMVAGLGTSAKTMIDLAGGENAFKEFDDYKPLTQEAVVAANPDVILMMDSGLESVGGEGSVKQLAGVRMTNAAKNDRIHAMDGAYLLGFGPRMGQAVLDLMEILHPEVSI